MRHRYSRSKRGICFVAGLALCGVGVALSTRPGLGTSPITSPAYALTFIIPLSLGMWTILMNTVFVGAQIAILGRKFEWIQLAQLPAVGLFGFFIDFGMWLTRFYIPEWYFVRGIEQLLGCLLLAVGIGCELAANVTYLPGEGLIMALTSRFKWNFGTVKICFDSSLVAAAIVISLVGTGDMRGVREGTVIAALTVGFMLRKLHRPLRAVKKTLLQSAG